MHELLGRIFVHGDLLEHHLTFGLELREGGCKHHVAHHVDGRHQMVVGDSGIDERVLA